MTAARTIQNFRGFRGIWCGPLGRHEQALRAGLARLGCAAALIEEVGAEQLCVERDVLFIDSDALFDPALAMPHGRVRPTVPVIGVVGVEAPSRLKALRDAGATAFLHKPIHPATVYPSLFLAVNNHAHLSRLETQIAEHNLRRGGRRHVIRAVIQLMHQDGLTDEQAYVHLRRESMRRRIAVEEFARALCLESAEAGVQFPSPEKEISDETSSNEAAGDGGTGGYGIVGAGSEPSRRSDQARRARGPIR